MALRTTRSGVHRSESADMFQGHPIRKLAVITYLTYVLGRTRLVDQQIVILVALGASGVRCCR